MISLGLVVTLWRKEGEARGCGRRRVFGSAINSRSIFRTDGQMGLGGTRRYFVVGLFFGGRSRGARASVFAAATFFNRVRRRRFATFRLPPREIFHVFHPSSFEGCWPMFPLSYIFSKGAKVPTSIGSRREIFLRSLLAGQGPLLQLARKYSYRV
jgi:hypothetical protein